jgi:hypothetical protein
VAELKRSLATIKTNQQDVRADASSDAPDNAGDSFGGHQQRSKRRLTHYAGYTRYVAWRCLQLHITNGSSPNVKSFATRKVSAYVSSVRREKHA